MPHSSKKFPYLGFGLGLRPEHYESVLQTNPAVDWFEVITENYMIPGGKPLYYLDKIRENYPVVMHGVSLSLGSEAPLNQTYLKDLKELIHRVRPLWISDHLCWTGIQGLNAHDLLPLPYTEEGIQHLASRIQQVQDYLGQQILIENVSSYVTYQSSEMSEWEFINEIARQADCFILLDINNVYVSGFNHHFDPLTYLYHLDKHRVQQFHLAGHLNTGRYIIDTHDAAIIEPVWALYENACKHFGAVSTMIERDDNIPPLEELLKELNLARAVYEAATAKVLS
jgi:uncharacterized protein (UPF0276 family)